MREIILDPKTPTASAKAFVRARYAHEHGRTLHWYRGTFYVWTGTHYQETDDASITANLYRFLEAAKVASARELKPFNPRRASVNEILHALEHTVLLPPSEEMPFWLDDLADIPGQKFIACRNGILDLSNNDLLPHTPLFFNANAVNIAFNPAAAPPHNWLRFLDDLWPGDQESKDTLAEIFGYALTPDTSQQKVFLIVGPPRSGKGTIGQIATALMGRSNVASTTFAQLGSNFGLAALINKRVAIIADARLDSNRLTVVERLLSISGEDDQPVDRKYQAQWTGKLGVRFVIMSNELPRLPDASGALPNRFVLLRIRQSFLGREDLDLLPRLRQDLPGILNWSLGGLARLQARGRFEMPAASLDEIRVLADLASPVKAFIRERCEVGPAAEVTRTRLFNAWKKWCGEEGHREGSQVDFGRQLRAAVPTLDDGKLHGAHAYRGIRLKDEDE